MFAQANSAPKALKLYIYIEYFSLGQVMALVVYLERWQAEMSWRR